MREDGSAPLEVDVFVNYYSGQKGSRALLNGNNKMWAEDVWRSVSEGTAEEALGERHLTVREVGDHFGRAYPPCLVDVLDWRGLYRQRTWRKAGEFTSGVLRTGRFGGHSVVDSAAKGLNEARVRLGLAFHALDGLNARLEQASKN